MMLLEAEAEAEAEALLTAPGEEQWSTPFFTHESHSWLRACLLASCYEEREREREI